ncbi:hypothetical protein CRENBAI_004761 [Crenichthys baileyi]|uniref:Uncharacterized protein n=1 Tax=Crenichthys baileyi TaxID=28760 RepID=A0AAV9RGM2_9TELE
MAKTAIYSHLIAFTCSPCLFSTPAPVYICKSCGSLCPLLASSVSLLPACSNSCFPKNPSYQDQNQSDGEKRRGLYAL